MLLIEMEDLASTDVFNPHLFRVYDTLGSLLGFLQNSGEIGTFPALCELGEAGTHYLNVLTTM